MTPTRKPFYLSARLRLALHLHSLALPVICLANQASVRQVQVSGSEDREVSHYVSLTASNMGID